MLCKGHYVITSLFENVIYCGISESRSHGQEISWEVCFKDKDQTFLVSGLCEPQVYLSGCTNSQVLMEDSHRIAGEDHTKETQRKEQAQAVLQANPSWVWGKFEGGNIVHSWEVKFSRSKWVDHAYNSWRKCTHKKVKFSSSKLGDHAYTLAVRLLHWDFWVPKGQCTCTEFIKRTVSLP